MQLPGFARSQPCSSREAIQEEIAQLQRIVNLSLVAAFSALFMCRMAESKDEPCQSEVTVTSLRIEPEESEDVAAPVAVTVGFQPSEPIEHAVWLMELLVDSVTSAGASRHLLPLGCCYVSDAKAGTELHCRVEGHHMQAEGIPLSDLSSTCMLRLSLLPLSSSLDSLSSLQGDSDSKGEDRDLATASKLAPSLPSLVVVNMVVDIEEAEPGKVQRVIYNPME